MFNPYAAGAKNYGLKGAPNIGPVDKLGYRERERKRVAATRAFAAQNLTPVERATQLAAATARKNAALRRVKVG